MAFSRHNGFPPKRATAAVPTAAIVLIAVLLATAATKAAVAQRPRDPDPRMRSPTQRPPMGVADVIRVAAMAASSEAVFVQALRVADLLPEFAVSSNYTVFAPKDTAIFEFVRNNRLTLSKLFDMDDLEYILLSHFINGTKVMLSDLEEDTSLTAASGALLNVTRSPDGTWLINDQPIIRPDIEA
eukprot:CAMPEP_0117686798 /NCGR_PEP_ID=MMETSP0804-20121206/22700_1 /TAXON_ID=1074897 /ORGANISM="Tetraselmis astigmatica, Strain CCMP880" /LENGTH=184 /DNA_ID=CAMNT_0005498631 /DNA_START=18 /DNA_END=569 /DNA_ORIENTATION=-